MERNIVKKIGNLEMDADGVVYKTSKGGFKAPPLPESSKIPYPQIQPDEKPICGIYPSEINYIFEKENIDQMNALKELHYQEGLKAHYRALDRVYRKQQRKRIARRSMAFVLKFLNRCYRYNG